MSNIQKRATKQPVCGLFKSNWIVFFQHGANDSMKIAISVGRATSGITYVCMASHFS